MRNKEKLVEFLTNFHNDRTGISVMLMIIIVNTVIMMITNNNDDKKIFIIMKFEVFFFLLLMKQLARSEQNNSSNDLNPDLCDAGAVLYQLSNQANCKDLQLLFNLQFKYMTFMYQNHIYSGNNTLFHE